MGVLKDDREFIPAPNQEGLFVRNPNFTGSSWEVFRNYPCRLLKNFDEDEEGDNFHKIGDEAKVCKMPSNFYYISVNGLVICDDAQEGIDFERLPE